MSSDGHVSIGDVLGQLREEFPDITISKIRFLESQGLIDPERTPSGYRKFYAGDIERLRWILRQQKEHFLPLKVIKERLDEIDRHGGFPAAPEVAAAAEAATPPVPPDTAPAPARGQARAAATKAPTAPAPPPLVLDDGDDGDGDGSPALGGVSLTRSELAIAADLEDAQIAELEEFGIVVPSYATRDRALFDEYALEAARLAASFMRYGMEPRHLRMYRAFAEREATLFEQVLLPFRRQRNPEAKARADDARRELVRLGRQLRTVLLAQATRGSAGG